MREICASVPTLPFHPPSNDAGPSSHPPFCFTTYSPATIMPKARSYTKKQTRVKSRHHEHVLQHHDQKPLFEGYVVTLLDAFLVIEVSGLTKKAQHLFHRLDAL